MNDGVIFQKMNDYLREARYHLAVWLSDKLPKVSSDWHNVCIMDKLGEAQKAKLANTDLIDYDLAVLIRIASKNWTALRSVYDLSASEGETVRAMYGVRSNWSNQFGTLPGKDAIVHDIEILSTFFGLLDASQSLLDDIDSFEKELESPGGIAYQTQTGNVATIRETPQESVPIEEKTVVRLVGDPNETGVVLSVDTVGGVIQYQVFLGGLIRTFFDGQIEPLDATPKFHWVDLETFQSYLSAYQINNPSAGNLYSLNAARIDFVPYQFRPALKMIKADEPRILIADSVGVGKTIEAGLIIKELEARGELENIMIICPKPLVSERKWENEMKRFDEEFIPLTGSDLRRIIADTHEDSEWPARYNKTIVPYSILDSRVYEGEEGRCLGLSDLDPAPHFDLVIVDEAHHIRNGSMDKEKAYAFKCVKYFCDHADAVVMLTATPLQTGDNDLYTLLHILRPDIVLDQETFRVMSRPNAHISRASSLVRAAAEGWQQAAAEQLTQVLATQWGENVIAQNPLYASIISRLSLSEISREERVRLITDIESLHSFHG